MVFDYENTPAHRIAFELASVAALSNGQESYADLRKYDTGDPSAKRVTWVQRRGFDFR